MLTILVLAIVGHYLTETLFVLHEGKIEEWQFP